MAVPQHVSLFSEMGLEFKVQPEYSLSCPTLDLATHWDSSSRNLLIYRPPNQVVSKIHQAGAPGSNAAEAVAVTWKPDGRFLAVGWSDGAVRLMGLENNKAAHHIPMADSAVTKVTHIAWASSKIALSGSLAGPLKHSIAKHWGDKTTADLPRELMFLEVEAALPKISPLPAASAGADDDATVFTLRTGIEFLFQSPRPEDQDRVNVMVVGTDDGKLQLNVYDSFLIGSFTCPLAEDGQQMVSHAFNESLPTQALVFASSPRDAFNVHIVPMDLPFISSSPINLSLLASKLTTLQKLLRYITQTQLHMQVEWNNARELPGRFLRSISVDLEEQSTGPRSIVPALYHSVLTGHAHGPLKEWLLESLAERGHKRWDKAVVSGLENLRSLIHENFLPALERCNIILSRLRGLAQFHDDRDDIGFSAVQVSRLLEIVGCLSLVGHKVLGHIMDELEHFNAFSSWLRLQIDRLASSSSSAGSDELSEKEANMNTPKVLTYIERYLTGSPLDTFFNQVSKEDWQTDWDSLQDGVDLLPVLDSNLRKQETGQSARTALLHIDFLVSYLSSWCDGMFGDIAEAKKRSVRFGQPISLSIDKPISAMDVRMCQASENSHHGVIYTALASKHDDMKVHIFRSSIEITNGISSTQPTTRCVLDLGRIVVDVKFLNDSHLIILCSGAKPVMLSVAHESLQYLPLESDAAATQPDVTEFQLPEDLTVQPIRMEVHAKTDLRGELPSRVCLLGHSRTAWYTFALPS